jgi:hypothetical protein
VQYILAKRTTGKGRWLYFIPTADLSSTPLSIKASSSLPPLAATFSQICPKQQGNWHPNSRRKTGVTVAGSQQDNLTFCVRLLLGRGKIQRIFFQGEGIGRGGGARKRELKTSNNTWF